MNLAEATRVINDTLCDLEKSSKSIVESIDLRDIDMTTFKDTVQQINRTVVIKLKPLPGTHWA